MTTPATNQLANSTPTTGTSLLAAVKEHPDEWDRYLIYADWLEENDFDTESRVYRWMGTRKKRPMKSGLVRVSWSWLRFGVRSSSTWVLRLKKLHSYAVLPKWVYDRVKGDSFKTWDGAVMALANVLEAMRKDITP